MSNPMTESYVELQETVARLRERIAQLEINDEQRAGVMRSDPVLAVNNIAAALRTCDRCDTEPAQFCLGCTEDRLRALLRRAVPLLEGRLEPSCEGKICTEIRAIIEEAKDA
jgi:hypothetical protein